MAKPKGTTPAQALTGIIFIVAGVTHFVSPKPYRKIVPPALPQPMALVYISGFFEIMGGLGMFIPGLRRLASAGLAALLVAVWPANIYHTVGKVKMGGVMDTKQYHVVRLPLQPVMIWWVLKCGNGKK